MNISSFLASWVELPLQFVFIGLAYWHSINHKPTRTKIISNKRSTNSSNKNTEKVVLSWIPEVPGYQAQNEVAVELEEVEIDKKFKATLFLFFLILSNCDKDIIEVSLTSNIIQQYQLFMNLIKFILKFMTILKLQVFNLIYILMVTFKLILLKRTVGFRTIIILP